MRFAIPLFALLASMLPAQPAQADSGIITIAQVVDLSGPNGDTGKDFWTGAKVYFDSVNAKGGINGRRINHVFRDDQGQPAQTLALTRQLVQEYRPAVLFGYMGAEGIEAVAKDGLLARDNLALVGPYAGVDSQADSNVVYLRASQADEARKIVRQTRGLGLDRLAIYHGSDDLGRSGGQSLAAALAEAGLRPVANVADIRSNSAAVAQQIFKTQPQAVVLAAPTIASANFIREYRKLSPGTQFFALSSINHQTLLEFLGSPKTAQGVAVTTLAPSPFNPVSPIAREHVRAMKTYRDEAPSYASLEGYIAAKYLVDALKNSKSSDPATVSHAIAATRKLDLGGYLVEFNGNSRRGSRYIDLAVFTGSGTLTN